MAVVLLLLIVLLAALALRSVPRYFRFRQLELAIPGPSSLPIFGNAFAFLGVTEDKLFDNFLHLWGGRSELSRITVLSTLFLIASDPDDIEEVIRRKETQEKAPLIYGFVKSCMGDSVLTVNGAAWRAHRRAAQPAFHQDVVVGFQNVFNEECNRMLSLIQADATQDPAANLQLTLIKMAVRTFLKDILRQNGEEDNIVPLIEDLCNDFPPTIVGRAMRPWLWSDFVFELTPTGRKLRYTSVQIDRVGNRIIRACRSRMLKEAEAAGEVSRKKRTVVEVLLASKGTVDLTDEEILKDLKIFVGTAVESPTACLEWTFKVLSVRQDIQHRVLKEVDAVLGEEKTISSEQLDRLEYMERVIKESLRLLPPIPLVARRASEEAVFRGKTIPKDSNFILNIFGAHRDPRHWKEPLIFDPDRFLPERSEDRHRYAYLPFSLGPRDCVAQVYAFMLMKTLLAKVFSQYRVDPVDDGYDDPSCFPMTMGIASHMTGGAKVIFRNRVKCDQGTAGI